MIKDRRRICALLFFAPTPQSKVFNWSERDSANIKIAYAIGMLSGV